MAIWTVTLSWKDPTREAWVSSFSTEDKALAFMRALDAKCAQYGLPDDAIITIDSGELDSEHYLDWMDSEYGEAQEI